MKRYGVALVALVLALGGCGSAVEVQELRDPDVRFEKVTTQQVPSLGTLAEHSRAAGVGLIAGLDPAENMVTSPLSLTLALGMLAEGANGQALQELEDVLGVHGLDRSYSMAAAITMLRAHDGDIDSFNPDAEPSQEPFVHVANQLLVDDDFTVEIGRAHV